MRKAMILVAVAGLAGLLAPVALADPPGPFASLSGKCPAGGGQQYFSTGPLAAAQASVVARIAVTGGIADFDSISPSGSAADGVAAGGVAWVPWKPFGAGASPQIEASCQYDSANSVAVPFSVEFSEVPSAPASYSGVSFLSSYTSPYGPLDATAKPLPGAFCAVVQRGASFKNVFSVRPRSIIVGSSDGGELVIDWRRWTRTTATGAGTAHPDHGTYPITVVLSDPIDGEFTRLTIVAKLKVGGELVPPDRLALATLGHLLEWVQSSAVQAIGDKFWPA